MGPCIINPRALKCSDCFSLFWDSKPHRLERLTKAKPVQASLPTIPNPAVQPRPFRGPNHAPPTVSLSEEPNGVSGAEEARDFPKVGQLLEDTGVVLGLICLAGDFMGCLRATKIYQQGLLN